MEIIPGDPARALAGPSASAESIDRVRETYGFDDPLPVRYVAAMARMAQGDLGYSFSKAEPVTAVLLRSLPSTLLLTGLAFLVEVLIAIPLALWVVSRGGLADRLLLIAAGATSAIPAFLVGLLLIYVFAFRLDCCRWAGPTPRRPTCCPSSRWACPSGWCWHGCCGPLCWSNRASPT